jgi:Ni/Co efflux regulator RcnB
MLLPAAPGLAQPQTQPQSNAATVQPDSQGTLAGSHTNQTTGGQADNPAPHIYKKGEHLSRGYGAFDDVMDWAHFNLMRPPSGSHWVKFGDNYLLVDDKSGLISDIVKAG